VWQEHQPRVHGPRGDELIRVSEGAGISLSGTCFHHARYTVVFLAGVIGCGFVKIRVPLATTTCGTHRDAECGFEEQYETDLRNFRAGQAYGIPNNDKLPSITGAIGEA